MKTYSEATDVKTLYVLLEKLHYETVVAKWQKYKSQGRAWRNQDMSNNTNRDLERHLKHAGIEPEEPLSIHTLRKSCIQNWANNITNPKVTQRLAGHADLKTTMQYYCQVTENEKARVALAIENLLKKTDVKVTYGGDLD